MRRKTARANQTSSTFCDGRPTNENISYITEKSIDSNTVLKTDGNWEYKSDYKQKSHSGVRFIILKLHISN